jgi:hypothetical protein
MQLTITLTLDNVDAGHVTDDQYVYTKGFIEDKLLEIAEGFEANITEMEIE